MITANVGIWGNSCVCFADAGLEALGCQEEVYLVVNLPIRGMPGCYPRQLVGVGSVGKDESVLFVNSRSLHPLSFVSPMQKSSYCPCQVLLCIRAYSGIPNALNYNYILLGSLCYDTVKLLVELFNLLVFMV